MKFVVFVAHCGFRMTSVRAKNEAMGVGSHLGSQSICDVDFEFLSLGSSQHRDPT